LVRTIVYKKYINLIINNHDYLIIKKAASNYDVSEKQLNDYRQTIDQQVWAARPPSNDVPRYPNSQYSSYDPKVSGYQQPPKSDGKINGL
jgi:hypothetical protein